MKLTPAKRKTLKFLADRDYVSAWPVGIYAPRSFRKALEDEGYIERVGADPGVFGFIRYRITNAGRDLLKSA